MFVGFGCLYAQPTHKYRKLSPRAKMVFLIYPEHCKGHVIYGEHSNGCMVEIDSFNVEFLEDEFPILDKIKNNV